MVEIKWTIEAVVGWEVGLREMEEPRITPWFLTSSSWVLHNIIAVDCGHVVQT